MELIRSRKAPIIAALIISNTSQNSHSRIRVVRLHSSLHSLKIRRDGFLFLRAIMPLKLPASLTRALKGGLRRRKNSILGQEQREIFNSLSRNSESNSGSSIISRETVWVTPNPSQQRSTPTGPSSDSDKRRWSFESELGPKSKKSRIQAAWPPSTSQGPSPSDERDPKLHRDELREIGLQISRWIKDPNEPGCQVRHRTPEQTHYKLLTMLREDLILEKSSDYWVHPFYTGSGKIPVQAGVPPITKDQFTGWQIYFNRGRVPDSKHILAESRSKAPDLFHGATFPGGIIMHNAHRTRDDFPHISEIAASIYTKDFRSLDSLRYVYATTVVNAQTHEYVMDHIYNDPSKSVHQPRMAVYNTRFYDEILGTRVGRIVGYLMLGGFPRGQYRIARVVTYLSKRPIQCGGNPAGEDARDHHLNIRFDIEPILNKN